MGVDDRALESTLGRLMTHEVDAADLYFQHQRTNMLAMEDGIVSRANSGISQGVGLRVVIVANLAPRTIRGLESQGMVLMAEEPRLYLLQARALMLDRGAEKTASLSLLRAGPDMLRASGCRTAA